MAITISGSGITSANIADGTITTDDILASDVSSLKSGRKNLIINGDMRVSQRGTSFNVGSVGMYTLDRFTTENEATGMTVSQDTDSPVGFSSSLKCLNGTGVASSGSDACYIRQYLEGYNTNHLEIGTANAKTVTLSFWVKSSITGTYIVSFLSAGRDDGYATSYTISSANTWEYKTVTLTLSDYTSWSGSTSDGANLAVHFDLGSGPDRDFTSLNVWNDNVDNKWTHSSQVDWVATTGATFYLTGLQLELGSVATDFEHRSYGEELALCQRYYFDYGYAAGADTVRFNPGAATVAAAKLQMNLQFPVGMRAAPTITVSSNGNADGVLTTLNQNGNGRLTSSWAGAADVTANYGTIFCVDDNDTVKTGFRGYFKADAEL